MGLGIVCSTCYIRGLAISLADYILSYLLFFLTYLQNIEDFCYREKATRVWFYEVPDSYERALFFFFLL